MELALIQCRGVVTVFRAELQSGHAAPYDPLFPVSCPSHSFVRGTALTAYQQFCQGVFTGDMEKALNGIKDIFKSVFNGIISTVEVAINHIVEGLNGISFDVPDWVPLAGGQHFGFNVSSKKLPRLATGTVVPRQAGEFAAILGDNNREAEVVSPLSTIKQALLEALKEAGAGLGGDIQLMINLDGKVVYENVVKRNRLARKQTGKNPLLV